MKEASKMGEKRKRRGSGSREIKEYGNKEEGETVNESEIGREGKAGN